MAPFRTRTRFGQERSSLSPDVISWSADAIPTGPDDPELILSSISTASDSVWSAFRMASHHLPNETEEEWKHRRNEAFRELAPLMDRVGRLVVDASSLIQSIGNDSPSLNLPFHNLIISPFLLLPLNNNNKEIHEKEWNNVFVLV